MLGKSYMSNGYVHSTVQVKSKGNFYQYTFRFFILKLNELKVKPTKNTEILTLINIIIIINIIIKMKMIITM